MSGEKHVIWSETQESVDAEEDYLKDSWINEVQAQLGVGESNDTWVPSGLVQDAKDEALDAAVNEAVSNHESTIDYAQAYRDFARPENIEPIIEDGYLEQFYDVHNDSLKENLDIEVGNLRSIDISRYVPMIQDEDGYERVEAKDRIQTAGDLVSALADEFPSDECQPELFVKNGEMFASERAGYAGERDDHRVVLVPADTWEDVCCLDGSEIDKVCTELGINCFSASEDIAVAMAERDGSTFDIAQAIADVYGFENDRDSDESLDEMMSAKATEAEIGQDAAPDVAQEIGER